MYAPNSARMTFVIHSRRGWRGAGVAADCPGAMRLRTGLRSPSIFDRRRASSADSWYETRSDRGVMDRTRSVSPPVCSMRARTRTACPSLDVCQPSASAVPLTRRGVSCSRRTVASQLRRYVLRNICESFDDGLASGWPRQGARRRRASSIPLRSGRLFTGLNGYRRAAAGFLATHILDAGTDSATYRARVCAGRSAQTRANRRAHRPDPLAQT